jgi:hypothetical protein
LADFEGLAAVGTSVVALLNRCFRAEEPVGGETSASAVLVTTEDFRDGEGSALPSTGVSVFVYRVDVNSATRAAWSSVAAVEGRSQLPLDLHFLLTPWASNAVHELQILGKAMQCLEDTPILTGPLLDPAGGWAPREAVQIVLGEITTEEVMRTFDSLPRDYKLSVPYIARVVRLTGTGDPRAPEVHTALTGIRSGVTP